MSYLTQSHANRPAAIAGVIAVHAGLAAVILAGFAVADVVRDTKPRIIGVDIKDPPPPDPQPQVKPKPEAAAIANPIHTPIRPIAIGPITLIETDPVFSEITPLTLPLVDVGTGAIRAIRPAIATPRNDPGGWVSDVDYKSRWIREGRYGTASFRLEVAANGHVDNCTITKSTGHSVLDQATCDLITRRARFKPATDASGAAISGGYESSIRWQLPD